MCRRPSWTTVVKTGDVSQSSVTSCQTLASEEFVTNPLLDIAEDRDKEDADMEEEEAYYSDSDSFVTVDSDSDTIENSGGDSDSAIGSESFCVNPFFN